MNLKEIDILFELVTLVERYNKDTENKQLRDKRYNRLVGFVNGVEMCGFKVILNHDSVRYYSKINSIAVTNLTTNETACTEI